MKKIQTNKATHVKTLAQLQLIVSRPTTDAKRLLFVELTESKVVIFQQNKNTVLGCLLETPLETKGFLRHPQSLQWYLEKAPVSARATHSCHFSPVGTEWTCLRTSQDFRSFLLWTVPEKNTHWQLPTKKSQKRWENGSTCWATMLQTNVAKVADGQDYAPDITKIRCGTVFVVWELTLRRQQAPNFDLSIPTY